MRKTTMRSSLTRAVWVGALVFGGTTPTYADHAYVFGGVTIYRSSGPAVAEYVSKYTTCSWHLVHGECVGWEA